MATQIGKLYAIIGLNTAEFDRKMKGVGERLSKVGRTLTMRLTLPLIALGTAAVKMGADFEQSMKNAASVCGATGKEFERMETVAREMGKTTIFTGKEAGDAMYYMASAGWKAEEMIVALEPTLSLAAATQSELAFTTNTVVATLNQFQLGAEGAERVTNVYAAAIANSQATLERLGLSMRYVGPIANSMGKSIEEATATLMGLYDAGYDASMAGTALRMAIAKLMDPSSKTKEALEGLGLSVEDISPDMYSFADIMDILRDKGAKTAEIFKIFGVRSGPAMAALLAQGGDALRQNEKDITNTKKAAEMMDVQTSTLKGTLKKLWAQINEIAIQISKVLIPILQKLVKDHIQPAIKWFMELSEKSKKFGLVLAGLAAASGPIMMFGGKLLKFIATPMGKVTFAITAAIYIFKRLRDELQKMPGAAKAALEKIVRLDEESGRLVGLRELIIKAKEASISMRAFADRLEDNKNDINKTMEELARGQIDSHAKSEFALFGLIKLWGVRVRTEKGAAKELTALYNRMAKEREEAAEKEAEAEKRVQEAMSHGELQDKARLASKDALAAADYALTSSLEDQRVALDIVNEALKHGIHLDWRSAEALQARAEQLEANIKILEARKKAEGDIANIIKETTDTIQKYTLDEFTYRKEKAWETYRERKAVLDAGMADEKAHAQNKKALDAELGQIEKDRTKKIEEYHKARGEALGAYFRGAEDKYKQFKDFYASHLDALRQLTLDEFEYKQEALDEEYQLELEKLQGYFDRAEISQEEFNAAKKVLDDEYKEKKKGVDKEIADSNEETLRKMREDWENTIQSLEQLVVGFVGRLNAIFSQFYKNQAIRLENDYTERREWIEQNVEDEEEREKLLEELDVEFRTKQRDARKKAAIAQKAIALMEAIVNTASAVAEALPNIPLAIAVGILGAAQIATIAAQPIPLKEGAIVKERTIAELAENKPEVVLPLERLPEMLSRYSPPKFKATQAERPIVNIAPVFNVNALDSADVETFLKEKAIPILQDSLKNEEMFVYPTSVREY